MNPNKAYNYSMEKTKKERKRRAIKRKTRSQFPFVVSTQFPYIIEKCVKCGCLPTERHHYPINEKLDIQFDVFDFFCHDCHMRLHGWKLK